MYTNGKILTATLTLVAALVSVQAHAFPILLGTASGGIGVYYNTSGGIEDPTNVAYVQAVRDLNNGLEAPADRRGGYFQFSTADLGGGVSFNDIFSGQPAGASQFGFDLTAIAPTWDGTEAVPPFFFADNNTPNGGPAMPPTLTAVPLAAPGDTAWAINDYNGPGVGVNDPNSIVRNSLFRGTDIAVDFFDLTAILDMNNVIGFQIDVAGRLQTDGLIHWSGTTIPDTPISLSGIQDEFLFEGTLTYLIAGDTSGNLYDFYGGDVNIYVNTLVPEPASMLLFGLGLAGLAMRRKFLA